MSLAGACNTKATRRFPVLNNTPQWVSLVETGKQNLRIHTLVRLARALKVPMPSLLDPPEVPPPAKTRGRPRKDQ